MSTSKIVRRTAPGRPKQPDPDFKPMTRSNYFFPDELKRGLGELAARKQVSEATIVRQALESYLRRHKVDV